MRRPRVQLSENSSNQLSENSLLLSGYPGYGKAKLGMVLDPSQIDRARLRLLKRNLLKMLKMKIMEANSSDLLLENC